MQIIPGSSNYKLAEKIAIKSGYDLLQPTITKFADGELKIQIEEEISDKVVILQSTCRPANDNLLELIFIADTARRAGAKEIIAVIPYFGYSRQDRCTHKHGPISSSAVIKMIEAAGVTKVITVDLHSAQLEGMFSVPIINIEPLELFTSQIDKNKDTVIVSPDIGGINRARYISMYLGLDLAIINKSRDSNNNVNMQEILGNVSRKNCVLIDDIVDSAGTLCKAAELLSINGAKNVQAMVSHGVLSGNAIDKILSSSISTIHITDSIFQSNLPDKFIQTSIAKRIAFYLQKSLGAYACND